MLNKINLFLAVALTLICVTPNGMSQTTRMNQMVLSVPINQYAIVLPVTIKGKTYRFFLDTGTSHTVIDNTLAATLTRATPDSQIPIAMRQMLAQGVATVDGHLGKDHIKVWQSEPITLGNYEIASADPWLGHDLSLMEEALGERIDGILGTEVFRQFSWAVDNVNKTLTVWRQAPSTLDYQECSAYSDSFGKSPGFEINFKKDWALFQFDSGTVDTLVTDDFLKFFRSKKGKVMIDRKNLPSLTASGEGHTESYLVDDLSFNGRTIGRMRVSKSKGVLNLGMSFMARFEKYLFNPNSMLFCYNAGSFTVNEQKTLRQIAVRYANGRIEVFRNADKEIASYGLKNGDKLLVINGRAADPARIMEVRRLFIEAPIGTLNLLIERDGRQIALSV